MVKALLLPLYVEWCSRHSNQKQKWSFKNLTDWLWPLWLRLYQHFTVNAHGNCRIAHIPLLREITFDLFLKKRLRVLLFEASHFLPDSFELQSGVQMVVSCILNTQHPQRYNYYLLSVGAILKRQLWDKPLRNPIEGYYTFLNQFCVCARVCGREQLNDSFLSAFPFFSAFIIQSYHPGPLNLSHKQNPCPKSLVSGFRRTKRKVPDFCLSGSRGEKKLMSQQLLKAVGV